MATSKSIFAAPIAGGLVLCMLLPQAGCSGASLSSIAKTEIDLATDLTIKTLDEHLSRLTIELYRLNPEQLAKGARMTLEARTRQIIEYPLEVAYQELQNKRGAQAVELAFDPDYRGDRVFAMMLGISSMMRRAYNGKRAVFITDVLDGQKLYNSARNLEVWKKRLHGQNGGDAVRINASDDDIYTRIDKMTALQDVAALIAENKGDRIINRTVHGAATAFFPIGL